MITTQKILLWIFLAMFVIPEVLWSPVGNNIYARLKPLENGSVQFFRDNFTTNADNINIASNILLIQFLGLLLSLIYIIWQRKNIQHKIPFWFSVSVLVLLSVVVFFVWGLSVSLRNIGL